MSERQVEKTMWGRQLARELHAMACESGRLFVRWTDIQVRRRRFRNGTTPLVHPWTGPAYARSFSFCFLRRSRSSAIESLTPPPFGRETHALLPSPMTKTLERRVANSRP